MEIGSYVVTTSNILGNTSLKLSGEVKRNENQ